MENVRNSLKIINRFARREYKEKRPKSVRVLRLKSKSILTRGILPRFQVKQEGPVVYLVVSDHGNEYTIYFFNRNGNRIGGQSYELTQKLLKELKKSTVLKASFPKKIHKKVGDSTSLFQKEFDKLFKRISSFLKINHKYSYTIFIKKYLKIKEGSTLGRKRVGKNLFIPASIKEDGFLELFTLTEWFFTYLPSLIKIIPEDQNKVNLKDLGLLIIGINDWNIIEQSSLSGLKLNNFLNEYSKNLIIDYLLMLSTLKKYRISLSQVEFAYLMSNTNNFFNSKNLLEKEIDNNLFFFKIFSQASKISDQEKTLIEKDKFLAMLFNLNTLKEPTLPLNEIIKIIKNYLEISSIYSQVLKIKNLISDILIDHIILYLDFELRTATENGIINIVLNIKNRSNYVLEAFSTKLKWKPKKVLNIIEEQSHSQHIDLHESITNKFVLEIRQKHITPYFSCKVMFTNPLFKERRMSKNIQIKETKQNPLFFEF